MRALEMIWEKGKPGEIYNIGASCERQNLEMIREVCQVMEEEGILMPSGAGSHSWRTGRATTGVTLWIRRKSGSLAGGRRPG